MATDVFKKLLDKLQTEEGNKTETAECEDAINHYKFYQFALIPAMAITLAFSATKTRKRLFSNLLNGRPGLIYPMDSLMRVSRMSYACCFSATAFLVYQIVLTQTYAIEDSGNRTVKIFVVIASMFIYGMVFYPLFSSLYKQYRIFVVIASMFIYGMVFYPLFCSLAVGSVFGYALGSLYVWMLTGVEIYKLTKCSEEETGSGKTMAVLRTLPSILCMLYLCVTLPIRVVVAFRQKRYFYWVQQVDCTDSLQDIQNTHAGQRVTHLFLKKKIKVQPTVLKDRIAAKILEWIHHVFYQRKKGFRYSSQIISVVMVSLLVVYRLTVEILTLAPLLLKKSMDFILTVTNKCWSTNGNFDPDSLNQYICAVVVYILHALRISVIVSMSLAIVFALISLLHILSCYRTHLLELYKGDHTSIPPASKGKNTSHMINCIKYAGYQVAYFIWGFVVNFIALLVAAFGLSIVISVYIFANELFVATLEYLWPIVFTFLLVTISQFLLAKFAFLQERGVYLALNNRRLYFNFTYFMFFYNIFMGLISCLLRIMKAILIGAIFLARLDSSNLPKRFEFLDPGFQAYVGFMHVEAAHTHPVMIVFVRLMLLGLQAKRNREAVRQGIKSLKDGGSSHSADGPSYSRLQVERGIQLSDIDLTEDDVQRRKRVAARFHWHVAFTLLHNPDIRVNRKGFMQILRQARSLGVTVPVSDRQGDLDVAVLQRDIAKAKSQQTDKKGILGKDLRSKFNGAVSDVTSHVLDQNDVKHRHPKTDNRKEQELHIEFGSPGTSDSENRQSTATKNSSSSAITPAFSNPVWESFS